MGSQTHLCSARRTGLQGAMNEVDTVQGPVLAMPRRPNGRLTLRQFLRVVRDNTLATYPPEASDEDIIARRLLWRRRFIINEPNAVREVVPFSGTEWRLG